MTQATRDLRRLPSVVCRLRLATLTLLGLSSVPVVPALDWTNVPGGRFASVDVAGEARVGFTRLTPEAAGVLFTNVLPAERHLRNQILLNGSGVTAGDVDGDGWCDLFFSGLGGCSALFLNRGGWHFEEATRPAGLALGRLDATGAALADTDGDGDLDLILNSIGGGTHCYANDGRGHFAAAAGAVPLNPGHGGSSLALADLDGDGDLDLYVANYQTWTIRDQPAPRFSFRTVDGTPQVVALDGRSITNADLAHRFDFRYRPAPGGGAMFHDELGEPDALFENLGGGRFAALAFTNGAFRDEQGVVLTKPLFDWGLSVQLRDLNGDGTPDIYVCNDFTTPDRIWLNDGRAHFRALPAFALRQTTLSAMALDVADINRDGFDDIFTADMLSREPWRRLVQKNEPNPDMSLFVDVTLRPQFPRNMLQLNRGDGTYAEIAQLAGLEASEWTWTPVFLDVDLDGYEDLLVANGFERDYMNMDANRQIMQRRAGRPLPSSEIIALNRLYPRLVTANLAFRNLGNLTFAEVGAAWGFDLRAISQGMCLADLDNDGDLDVVINNLNDAAALFRNDTTAPRVAVRLDGRPPNTRGIGAKIRLLGGAVPAQHQEMMCGGRYLSSDDPMRVFAAGTLTNRMTLEVTWRNGFHTVVSNVVANRIYTITENVSRPSPPVPPAREPKPIPLFEDVSGRLLHVHQHAAVDDFERQPLLPYRLSALGPGVAWFDLDEDGRDDLVIAAGRGFAPGLFRNEPDGRFLPLTNTATIALPNQSQTAVLGWRGSDGRESLLVGWSAHDDAPTNPAAAQACDLSRGTVENLGPAGVFSAGPLAMADVDGDGELELFLGGRSIPGRWPEAATSRLLCRRDGRWVLDDENTQALAGVGLVSGAVFTDLDADGSPDLALACEWGPVKVFRNRGGRLIDATTALGLNRCTGWWNGINAGDFDGDGRMDLVASNWGRNTKYERFRSRPLRIYYGDFNGDSTVALIESWFDDALGDDAPIYNIWTMSRGLPWLLGQYRTYEQFSRATIGQILGDRARDARHWEVTWLDSTVFLNRGEHFLATPLPIEAQMAPAFGVCVADFDGDGHEDLFLSQNFFAVRPETSRYDAGRGLLLRGGGDGSFAAVPGQESGLLIYGEQRGAATGDFDGDGRTDLAVGQFGAETRVYRNQSAPSGLRVRLRGPPANPLGIGAQLRWKAEGRLGPAREIHAGSGYWSQDSAVQVVHGAGPGSELQIRWPGGRMTVVSVPATAREVEVSVEGTARVIR